MQKTHSWTTKQSVSAKVPNFGKKYLGEPELLKMIKPRIAGKKVLELGSGNGYWLEFLAKRGASCVGIEIADNQLKLARQGNPKIRYMKGDITKLRKLHLRERFDVILLEHVLLEISSVLKIKAIMTDAFKLLNKHGLLIISDLHPFAPVLPPKNMQVGKNFHYFSSGAIVKVISKRLDGKKTVYKDFHWTLSDIVGPITQAGFHIVSITEPRPTMVQAKRHPELAYRLSKPMGMWLKAEKP